MFSLREGMYGKFLMIYFNLYLVVEIIFFPCWYNEVLKHIFLISYFQNKDTDFCIRSWRLSADKGICSHLIISLIPRNSDVKSHLCSKSDEAVSVQWDVLGINICYLVKIRFRQSRSLLWKWDVQIPNETQHLYRDLTLKSLFST